MGAEPRPEPVRACIRRRAGPADRRGGAREWLSQARGRREDHAEGQRRPHRAQVARRQQSRALAPGEASPSFCCCALAARSMASKRPFLLARWPPSAAIREDGIGWLRDPLRCLLLAAQVMRRSQLPTTDGMSCGARFNNRGLPLVLAVAVPAGVICFFTFFYFGPPARAAFRTRQPAAPGNYTHMSIIYEGSNQLTNGVRCRCLRTGCASSGLSDRHPLHHWLLSSHHP